jgi:hypothetical protein
VTTYTVHLKLHATIENIYSHPLLESDIGFVYRRTDGHGETSIPPYNFVAGGIMMVEMLDMVDNRSLHPHLLNLLDRVIYHTFPLLL